MRKCGTNFDGDAIVREGKLHNNSLTFNFTVTSDGKLMVNAHFDCGGAMLYAQLPSGHEKYSDLQIKGACILLLARSLGEKLMAGYDDELIEAMYAAHVG